MSDRRVFGQYAILIVLALRLAGVGTAFAQSCAISRSFSPYNLTADTVSWSMKIVPGTTCFGGLRYGNVDIVSVKLISPPSAGHVALQGPGFSYTAKANFHGEDTFTLAIFGAINNRRGNSTVRITVSDLSSKVMVPNAVQRSLSTVPAPQAPTPSITNDNRLSTVDAALPPCPVWDWSKGSPSPMRQPFDRSKLFCPPSPFRPPNPPIGCVSWSRPVRNMFATRSR